MVPTKTTVNPGFMKMTHCLCLAAAAIGVFLVHPMSTARADQEIGFVETFALAPDRGEALKQLIPGTADFYYYHALHAQNTGRFEEVDRLLEPWTKRYGETDRVWEIRHRQALLRYRENPKATIDHLKRHLGLSFGHQRAELEAKPDFPTRLDPEQIAWDRFLAEAFRRSNTTAQVTDHGLDRLLREDVEMDETRRRHLLSRLRYPDYPNLVRWISADLRTQESRGFGEFQIHRDLLPEQLDALLGLRPELIHEVEFVHVMVRKLHPDADSDWRGDAAEREAYLRRVWGFVETLQPSFNSLKAHVLYHLLQHFQRAGVYPRDLFMKYLRLPRPMHYVEPRYLSGDDHRRFQVDLNADFSEVTGLPRIAGDEGLVRDYLAHYFFEEGSWEAYAPFVRDTYLKPLFAEVKLTRGVGAAERWFSLLDPDRVQAIRGRVDLEFAPDNPVEFEPGNYVELDVYVKNVRQLMVKVYEINALNYYLDNLEELSTDLNLDGLIANEEWTVTYDDPPIRRVRRSFRFDGLTDRRGVWVIELIGNGMSSRALVRKGRLQYLSRTTAAGTGIKVLTRANAPAPGPSVWHAGRRFEADANGLVVLPFSSEPGRRPIVLESDGFATLEWLETLPEQYKLAAGIHVDRESLLPGRMAVIAVRPHLTIHGEPAPVSLLEDVKLTLRSTDLDGIESVTEVDDFKLFDDRESLHAIRVPERLAGLRVELRGRVPRVSVPDEPAELSAFAVFELNTLHQSEHVTDFHLSGMDGGYWLECLGRTGEPRVDRAVRLRLWRRDCQHPLEVTVKTDSRGRVDLGPLDGIQHVQAATDGTPTRSWAIAGAEAQSSVPAVIHAAVGDTIQVACPEAGDRLEPGDLVLLERRAGTFVRNVTDHAATRGALLEIGGLTPGDYELFLRKSGRSMTIRVAAGEKRDGFILSRVRHLETARLAPLQIISVSADAETVRVELANSGPFTRVHVMATRFLPEFHPGNLALPPGPAPGVVQRGSAESVYLSGRDIGEEYRYILERRAAVKFPGIMVTRPGLLLNPWALRDTRTSLDEAAQGDDYARMAPPAPSSRPAAAAMESANALSASMSEPAPDLSFLRDPSAVVYNLAPDADGVVTFARSDLGDRQQLHILAVDSTDTVYRRMSFPEGAGAAVRDLRMARPLPSAKRFSQRRKVTVLRAGDPLTLADLRTTEYETYDTLKAIHAALAAVNNDASFEEFAFLLDWPDLSSERKRELYSEHACHELNFFLSRRDPAFFRSAVRPFLENKLDKTFLDHYLLDADLSRYTDPWSHGRLNVFERILLARRTGGAEARATARHIGELLELEPVDVERNIRFFRTALLGRQMLFETEPMARGRAGRGGAMMGYGLESDQKSESLGVAFERLPEIQLRRAKGVTVLDAVASVAERQAEAKGVVVGKEQALGERWGMAGRKQADANRAVARNMAFFDVAALRQLRETQSVFFQKLPETREWAENNYRHLPIAEQTAGLIRPNAFWKDYAEWDGEGGFFSEHFPAATANFTEMLLALSVLDLPFTAGEHERVVRDNVLTLRAASPVIVFHEEIEETPLAARRPPILVSQNFFRHGDPFEMVGGEKVDRYVTDEFLTGVLYGCRVVVTNPSSATRKLELLLQVPQGAMPANGSDYTRTESARIEPFSTYRTDYWFYFPSPSTAAGFEHYPVHVSKEDEVVAWAEPFTFNVVDRLSGIDEASWEYISQFGTGRQVLDYLDQNNVHALNLDRIAWRCREDAEFLRRVTGLLSSRHAWNGVLWSYGLYHHLEPVARDYLASRGDFLRQCGMWLEAPLITIDPVERHWFEHLEYRPLIHSRAHRLGRERKILNDRFRSQYQAFMRFLGYRREFSDRDRLGIVHYLFLQDRIGEGLAWLDRIESDGSTVDSEIQLDYLRACAALYREDSGAAATLAGRYRDYPIDHWRVKFERMLDQVEEIHGAEVSAADQSDRALRQDALAAREPEFDIELDGQNVTVTHQNLASIRVNIYEMDLEFLFSSNPFVTRDTGRFSYIRPNAAYTLDLPPGSDLFEFRVPEQFASKNVLVEVAAAGRKRAVAVYANALNVRVVENYGSIQIRHAGTGAPMGKVYVKVYARFGDGDVRFFKDGYTDLRGKFDYVSLNTTELADVERFSLLVMSEGDGALVRQAAPPQR